MIQDAGGIAGLRADRDLGRRLVTAALLVPLFLVAVAVGRVVFLGAVLLLVGAAAREYFRLAGRHTGRPRIISGTGLALAFPLLLYWASDDPLAMPTLLTLGVAGIALAQVLDARGEAAIGSVATSVFGAAYAGLLLGHLVLIREIPRIVPGMPYWSGALLVGIPLLLTWINDSAAYVVGHRWGSRRLLPRVSPGKTMEGAVGALLVTILAALPILWLIDRWVPLFSLPDALAVGALIGIGAPAGDLIESAFKRDAGVKDAGNSIPGHGGVLDRFDSLMVSVPVFWYYLRHVVLG